MADNSFRGDLRQCIGALVYRAAYRRLFDRAWVPGRSATQLMRFYGVPDAHIFPGLYTCDTAIFQATRSIQDRPLAFVFVGQLSERKNVIGLCRAFLTFHRQSALSCTLDIFGEGPLRAHLPNHPSIRIHDFATPQRLAAVFSESRCLVLPSILDHWGVVVHEAASCGMLLIVSDTTGAGADLCSAWNSRITRAGNEEDLVKAFQWAASLNGESLMRGSQSSQMLARQYSPEIWASTFRALCGELPA